MNLNKITEYFEGFKAYIWVLKSYKCDREEQALHIALIYA